jgi:hypothetical protein
MRVPLKFENRGGVWVAAMPTRYGIVELMVDGTPEKPDERQTAALVPFLARATEITETQRRKLRFGFLYRLIRVAVNQEGRVGLQFRNRLTGSQPLLLVDDPA